MADPAGTTSTHIDAPTSTHPDAPTSIRVGTPTSIRVGTPLWTRVDTPIGPLGLASDGEALTFIDLAGEVRGPLGEDAVLARAAAQLGEYFAGRRETFDLPLAPRGTPFQRAVWTQLAHIPFGQTVSYAAVAAAIGKPSAVRAVGRANGSNPLPIVLPCHRVIGADGSLTGYGGGIDVKAWLLTHEGVLTAAG